MPTACEEIRRLPDGTIPIEQSEALLKTAARHSAVGNPANLARIAAAANGAIQIVSLGAALLALLLARPIPAYAQPPPEAQVPDPHDAMEQEPTRLQIRGFGDVQFRASNEPGAPSTFSIGQLDLFITSRLASDLTLVSEVVFEADDENRYSLDVERLLLQFSPSDYFSVGVGRFHTAIGFYNTAYHHGAWFQTAVGRPQLFKFEDDDGILPVHGVGITARGRIPSGKLGLGWIGEIANGRRYGDGEAVQVVHDDSSFKAINVGLLLRPEWVPGLQSGLSVYRDKPAFATGHVDQSIIAAHVVYQSGAFEQLNEVVVIRDTPAGDSRTSTTTGIYTQLSHRFGRLSPYIRYEHLDVPQDDPLFGRLGGVSGPSIGARYDFRDLAALKIQWDRFTKRPGPSDPINAITAQVAFTF
jgi:hypothetical protein